MSGSHVADDMKQGTWVTEAALMVRMWYIIADPAIIAITTSTGRYSTFEPNGILSNNCGVCLGYPYILSVHSFLLCLQADTTLLSHCDKPAGQSVNLFARRRHLTSRHR